MISAISNDPTQTAPAAHDNATDTTTTPNRSAPPPGYLRGARWVYLALAWLFAACVVVQVFFAGMAIFVDSARWQWHTSFIHAFEFLPFLMLLVAFIARLPIAIRWLTIALFGLIFLQYFTANFGGLAGAFHPVNALLLTWLAVNLAGRTRRIVRDDGARPAPGLNTVALPATAPEP